RRLSRFTIPYHLSRKIAAVKCLRISLQRHISNSKRNTHRYLIKKRKASDHAPLRSSQNTGWKVKPHKFLSPVCILIPVPVAEGEHKCSLREQSLYRIIPLDFYIFIPDI